VPPKVAALVLAAGRSTRMGGPNKLLEEVGGVPVVRRVVEALSASGITDITLVTGHMPEAIAAAAGPGVTRAAYNPDYAEGLSTSLRAGLAHVPPDVDAVLVALGDMPGLTPALVGQIVAAFDPAHGRAIVVPTAEGRRGNPVLWANRFRDELKTLQGDVGARHLLGIHGNVVADVPVTGEGVLLDVDTPEALASARRLFGHE
jgi:molybdenum cofactor cytidylyltransferase